MPTTVMKVLDIKFAEAKHYTVKEVDDLMDQMRKRIDFLSDKIKDLENKLDGR